MTRAKKTTKPNPDTSNDQATVESIMTDIAGIVTTATPLGDGKNLKSGPDEKQRNSQEYTNELLENLILEMQKQSGHIKSLSRQVSKEFAISRVDTYKQIQYFQAQLSGTIKNSVSPIMCSIGETIKDTLHQGISEMPKPNVTVNSVIDIKEEELAEFVQTKLIPMLVKEFKPQEFLTAENLASMVVPRIREEFYAGIETRMETRSNTTEALVEWYDIIVLPIKKVCSAIKGFIVRGMDIPVTKMQDLPDPCNVKNCRISQCTRYRKHPETLKAFRPS